MIALPLRRDGERRHRGHACAGEPRRALRLPVHRTRPANRDADPALHHAHGAGHAHTGVTLNRVFDSTHIEAVSRSGDALRPMPWTRMTAKHDVRFSEAGAHSGNHRSSPGRAIDRARQPRALHLQVHDVVIGATTRLRTCTTLLERQVGLLQRHHRVLERLPWNRPAGTGPHSVSPAAATGRPARSLDLSIAPKSAPPARRRLRSRALQPVSHRRARGRELREQIAAFSSRIIPVPSRARESAAATRRSARQPMDRTNGVGAMRPGNAAENARSSAM